MLLKEINQQRAQKISKNDQIFWKNPPYLPDDLKVILILVHCVSYLVATASRASPTQRGRTTMCLLCLPSLANSGSQILWLTWLVTAPQELLGLCLPTLTAQRKKRHAHLKMSWSLCKLLNYQMEKRAKAWIVDWVILQCDILIWLYSSVFCLSFWKVNKEKI